MPEVKGDSAETSGLLDRVEGGDRRALEVLLHQQREPLRAFVEFHLDSRLRTRFDPSDVVQDTQMEATRRMDDFLRRRPMPFCLWLRKQAYERLLRLRRDHLERAKRTVLRESAHEACSSLLLARPLLRGAASPSEELVARERAETVARAVGELSEVDRAVLRMRHGEDLPYDEIAGRMGLEPAAARKRYGRAMIRLQRLLSAYGLVE